MELVQVYRVNLSDGDRDLTALTDNYVDTHAADSLHHHLRPFRYGLGCVHLLRAFDAGQGHGVVEGAVGTVGGGAGQAVDLLDVPVERGLLAAGEGAVSTGDGPLIRVLTQMHFQVV